MPSPYRRAARAPIERLTLWAPIALGVAALARGVREYYPFLCDDALISLRYSERLLEGRGLTWSDGPPVEGYSNLLWVLACSALGLLGIDLVTAARVLGIGGMVATIAVATWAVVRRGAGLSVALYVAGALGLAGSIEIWAIGGLEQAFVAPLLGGGWRSRGTCSTRRSRPLAGCSPRGCRSGSSPSRDRMGRSSSA